MITRSSMKLAGIAVALLAASLGACVGDDAPAGAGNTEPDSGTNDGAAPAAAPRIVSFSAAPTALPFGGGDAKLSFAIEGATSATIDNAVGDVTGKSTADVKLTKSTTYTLTATNAAGTVTATTKVDVDETFTVSGKIVTGGQPLANAAVVVGGRPITNTSALGTFSVTGVKPPYDVAFATGTPASITVYKGLTRKDPTLVAFGDSGPPSSTRRELMSIEGTVTAGVPFTSGPLVTVSGPNRVRGTATANMTTGYFVMDTLGIAPPVEWRGPTTTLATFHASADINGTPYYGKSAAVTLAENNAGGNQNIAMNMGTYGNIDFSVTGPAAFDQAGKTRIVGGVRFDTNGGGYETFAPAGAVPKTGTIKAHEVAGSTFYIDASYNRFASSEEASYARKAASAAPTVTLAVALPDPARPSAPADTATNVTTATAFSFTALAGGVQRITMYSPAQPTITVLTKDTSTTLPDLTPFAVALPKNTLYTWRVYGHAPLASLDDPKLADTLDSPEGELPPLVDVRATTSVPRTFTTAP